MNRVFIGEIVPEVNCRICGFIDKIRDSKNMIFVVLKDITGKIQIVKRSSNNNNNQEESERIQKIKQEMLMSIEGTKTPNENVNEKK